jgi:WD40 repeat protein
VWDVPSGKLLHRLPTKMNNNALAFSEDGKWIASGCSEWDGNATSNKVMVWELDTGKLKHEWTDPNAVDSVGALAFSPDSKLLAVGFDDAVRVLDVQTGKVKYKLSGSVFRKLAFTPDGKTLAGTGMDGKIILWDVANEKTRDTLPGHEKDAQGRGPFALDAVFSPDGRTLASCGSDGTMRFWPVAGQKK